MAFSILEKLRRAKKGSQTGNNYFPYQDLASSFILENLEKIVGAKDFSVDVDWFRPISRNISEDYWNDIHPFFSMDLSFDTCKSESWNITGNAGWGSAGASIEIETTFSDHLGLKVDDHYLTELCNVIVHEIHHLTQRDSPLERPSSHPLKRSRLESHVDYFLSDPEVPAFVAGFEAESYIREMETEAVMRSYLNSQVLAGRISGSELKVVLSTWLDYRDKEMRHVSGVF